MSPTIPQRLDRHQGKTFDLLLVLNAEIVLYVIVYLVG